MYSINHSTKITLYLSFPLEPGQIVLTADDITDKHIIVDKNKLSEYPKDHLVNWLKYRGDTLKGTKNTKDARVR